jgi:outer membrane autotransporter protein
VTGGSTVEFGSDGSAPIIGVRADGYVADGQRDVVVDATAGLMTLTTAPELADNETAVLSFALDFTANEIYVVANRKSYVEAMAGAGGPNAEAVAKTLDEARATATGDAASVLTRLDNLDSAEELGRALDSLTPEANHATVEAGLGATQAFEGGQVGRVAELKQLVGLQGIRVRVPQKAAPRGPGGPPFGTRTDIRLPQSPNVWAHGIGSWGDQDSRDGHLGWTYDTYGVVTGADHEFGNTIAGLSLGVADTDIESDRQGNHSEIASFHLGAYAVHALPEGVYVDGGLHYSRHWIDTYRSVFPFRQAEGETNADALGFHVGVSKDHQLGEWVVSPEGRIAYGYYAQDGYTEEGAGAMNLTVDNFNRHSFRTKLGVEATTGIHEYVSFNAHAYWTHEWCDNQASMQARFNDVTGSSWFDTDGLDPANANFNLGFGFNAQVSEEHLLYLTYDCDLRRDFTAHTVMLGVRCAF